MIPVILDMETADPDDFITLLLLAGHPLVDLRAVTATPGTPEQVGLVRWALAQLQLEVPVGAFNLAHPKNCVSTWHYKAYGMQPTQSAAPSGLEVFQQCMSPEVTLVCGAALKNLGAWMAQGGTLGRVFVQGGFAGEGVVPANLQLPKFAGMVTCPTFNLNGDIPSALAVTNPANRGRFADLRFISKNVCHRVFYGPTHHQWLGAHRLSTGGRHRRSLDLIYQGMEHYLSKHPEGKKFHDPLAACCAIAPQLGTWAEVTLFREGGGWGSRLTPGSGTRILVDYSEPAFLAVLGGGTCP